MAQMNNHVAPMIRALIGGVTGGIVGSIFAFCAASARPADVSAAKFYLVFSFGIGGLGVFAFSQFRESPTQSIMRSVFVIVFSSVVAIPFWFFFNMKK